eukprot:3857967-Pyramimonas_sp.AAC.1
MQGPQAGQYSSRTTAMLTSSSRPFQLWSAERGRRAQRSQPDHFLLLSPAVGFRQQPGLLFW